MCYGGGHLRSIEKSSSQRPKIIKGYSRGAIIGAKNKATISIIVRLPMCIKITVFKLVSQYYNCKSI